MSNLISGSGLVIITNHFLQFSGLWHPIIQDECRIMNEEADITCEELIASE